MLFNRTRHLLIMIGLAMLATIPAFAAEEKPDGEIGVTYNQSTQTRPDLGSPARSSTAVVGVNGYKVFNPGAIATAPIIATDGKNVRTSPLYRSGRTDAWLNWSWTHPHLGWEHFTTVQNLESH